jgi:hypothetical protein
MVDFLQSRRGFLAQLSIGTGVGIAGGLGLHKLLAGDSPMPAAAAAGQTTPQPAQPLLEAVSLAGPMLIHVRDVATAEVSMMVGTRELIYRDPELVSRLVSTAQSAKTAKQEG